LDNTLIFNKVSCLNFLVKFFHPVPDFTFNTATSITQYQPQIGLSVALQPELFGSNLRIGDHGIVVFGGY